MRALIHTFLSYKVIRFLISGGLSATIHIGTVFVLNHLLGIWYLYATAFGFLCAVVFNFIMQKFFTFQNTQTQTMHHQSIVFFCVALINFTMNGALMVFFVERIGLIPVIAQIVVALIIAVWSYIAYGRLFRVQSSNTTE